MTTFPVKKDDVSIVLCGAAGQGVQTVEQLLTYLFKRSGYHLFSTKEYMSRVRGGSNSTELRVSSFPVQAYVDRIDILVPLNREALKHVARRISSKTIIIGEREKLTAGDEAESPGIIDIRFSELATEIGGAIFSNIIAVGVLSALFSIDHELVDEFLRNRFAKKGETIVAKNIEAADKGFEIGADLKDNGTVTIELTKDSKVKEQIIVNGGEAVALGAIVGGCNFISSYPMTPSTSVLTYLSQQSRTFDIIVEQAEDEIAAMNMTIGAWYAGARGMVTTSGGGFALMGEGLSLAGIVESPMVIHLAQRPGPATGLPTRTEQGDLEFALYSGHGEFPRVIYAPGTIEDAFYLTHKAFNLADKYQVPVFIMTDQYFIDSYYTIDTFDATSLENDYCVVTTAKDYKRYELTADGVSPRGIPGNGEGLVVVDSDEHDECGHITEDHDIRIDMVEKRLRKADLLKEAAIPPELIGNENSSTLVVCWGSVRNIAAEAVALLDREDVALLHFKQVYPLHPDTARYCEKAEKLVIVEGNATCQFGRILKLHAGVEIETKILKYNGLAFSVEELTEKLRNVV